MKGGYEFYIFYNSLLQESKGIINASAGGSPKDKSVDGVQELFQRIVENGCTGTNKRRLPVKKQDRFLEVDAL